MEGSVESWTAWEFLLRSLRSLGVGVGMESYGQIDVFWNEEDLKKNLKGVGTLRMEITLKYKGCLAEAEHL